MKKLFTLLLYSLLLTGCSLFHVHKLEFDQGNIYTQEMVSRLRIGMSEAEVRNIMGNPVLINTFRENRLDYVYTIKPAFPPSTEKYVSLIFVRGRLSSINQSPFTLEVN